MRKRRYGSFLTRVVPVFDALRARDPTGRTLLPGLVELPRHGNLEACVHSLAPSPPGHCPLECRRGAPLSPQGHDSRTICVTTSGRGVALIRGGKYQLGC